MHCKHLQQGFHTACLIWVASYYIFTKSPFSFTYNFAFNLVNSFSKTTVQNLNTSDVGKYQIQI